MAEMKTTDGFKNVLKGLGTAKDGRQNRSFVPGQIITQNTADWLYSYNWLAAKCVDAPADDATKKWRTLLISDPDKKLEIEAIEKEQDIKGRVNQALKWARCFGGSAIVLVVDGDQEEPLDVDNIQKDSLLNIVVLDRYNIIPGPIDRDILSPNFGLPETYQVVRGGVSIHHTRVLRFMGQGSTIQQLEQNNYWGLSIFTKLWEPISDSMESSNSISTMLYESNIDVFRINGLNSLVANQKDDLVTKRLRIAHEMKSMVNAVVLDKEDEYDKKSNNFTTLPDIDDRFIQKVAGASGIPVTRLVGISPAGMNATGESDERNYYDNVSSIQENEVRPQLDVLDKVVLGSAGYEVDFEYEFLPLRQLTETEQADVELKRAQRDQVYLDHDVIEITDAMAELAENDTYTTIDELRIEEALAEEELFGEEEETENSIPGEEPQGAGEEIPEGAE